MYKHFEMEFFVGNRQRLRQLFTGTAPIVLTANGLMQRNSDVNFPFRQDSNFWYLTGVPNADVILVIDKDKEYLILPAREAIMETFEGAIDPVVLAQTSGIQTIYEQEEGWKVLGKRLNKARHIATVPAPPSYVDFYGFYTNPARAALLERIKTHNEGIELLDIQPHLTRQRAIKQAPEMAALKEAIAITIKGIKRAQRRTNKFEYDIEATLTATYRTSGGADHGWPPIVASGARACTIHHMDNNGAIDPKDMIIIDTGAAVDNYTADIARSFVQSTPSKRQRQVYEAVQAAQQHALGLLRPGVMMKDYEQAMEQYMGEKLRELGLIKTIDRDNVRKYFPHATSHFLGLDPHDAGDYQQPLEAGMVLAVEPGIYIPEEGLGVRLEDNVLITPKGNQVLTASLPQRLH
jgi:Xaa-Pro aminopeptidase